MRLRIVAVAAAASLLALTACGGGDADDGPATLRMTIWSSSPDHLALLNGIADEYRKAHPDVTAITFDSLPLDNYTTTLTTQLAGGNAPDLAWILENSAPDFVESGALVPLEDTLGAASGYEFDDLQPSTTKLWTQDDHLYAYPFSTSPFGVFVNNDLVTKAGQPTPTALISQGKWTWDAAFALGSAVRSKAGKAGLVVRDFDYKTWDNLATVWGGWGAEAWSEDGRTCGFDKPEMVAAMTALHDAIFTAQALPGPGTAPDFFAGDAAMTITQISRASLLKDQTFGWDLVPLPSGPAGEYSVIGQAGIGVLKKSKHADAATDFLAFLTNPANSKKLARFFPPPRRSQLNTETLAAGNPLLKPDQLQAVVIDGIDSGTVKPSHVSSAEIGQQVRSALDPLWKPGADVPAVLGSVCAAIAPLLKQ
ncbi:ABC transporter substrate-binding protein [Cryptosporangium arvum]|uniref:ABC transporter substrate-binding protein n=1 Tax=Cryptosporangium arvum TaxID=80871 RepID=UPI0004B3F292|nr:sugar ABC transporter substrate-binding protein [Cryptosporangium arvum]